MTEELMPQHKSHSVVDLEPVSVASNVVPMRRDPTAEDIAAAFLLGYSGSTRGQLRARPGDVVHVVRRPLARPVEGRWSHVDGWARQLGEIDGYSPTKCGSTAEHPWPGSTVTRATRD